MLVQECEIRFFAPNPLPRRRMSAHRFRALAARFRHPLPLIGLTLALPIDSVQAQSVPPSVPAEATDDRTVVLSPFEVSTSQDDGYVARDTLSGSRLATSLRDVPSQISIMTEEFLSDVAAVSLDDAFRYSLNVENTEEFASASSNAGDFNSGIINSGSNNRIRGLTAAGRTHDFFQTTFLLDSYNTERFTFSSGPNAILYGTGNPAGITDVTYKRPNLRRARYQIDFRTDNHSSFRTSVDANYPIIRDKLAVRVAGVKQQDNDFRKPGSNDSERFYGMITYKPWLKTAVRAYYEDVYINRYPARNTVVIDRVTPWIQAGRPAFNNGLSNFTPNPANTNPVFGRNTNANNVYLFGEIAGDVPIQVWGAAGAATGPTVKYSAFTRGPGEVPNAVQPDVYDYSLADRSVFPWDVNFHGNGTRNEMDGYVKGIILEQQVGSNLFLEAGFNQEENTNPFTDMVRGVDMDLQADANQFLPDRVTPNPNYGRYYFEGGGRGGIWWNYNKERRVSASYDLDLQHRYSWIGRHRLAAFYNVAESMGSLQGFDARVIGPTITDPVNQYNAGAPVTYRWRSYVSDPNNAPTGGTFWFNLPFDPFETTLLPNGATYYSIDSPYGATGQANISHTRIEGKVLALQSYLWKDRIVATLGRRWDDSRVANYRGTRLGNGGNQAAWQSYEDVPHTREWSNYAGGTTTTKGVVFHALPWLSAYYNESDTWNASRTSRYPDDNLIPGSTGEGQDYGLMFSLLDGRFFIRANKYENTSGPDLSTFRAQVRIPIRQIEERMRDLQDPLLFPPANFSVSPPGFVRGTLDPDNPLDYNDVTSDQKSSGYEVELTANPTRNWRLSIGAAKANAIEANIGKQWLDYLNERLPEYRKFGTWEQAELAANPGFATYITDRIRGQINNFNLMKQADGRANEQTRLWRVNVTSRYTFNEGPVKGLFAGGVYRWRSKLALGYRSQQVQNDFPFPGIPDVVAVPDINSPIYGRTITDIDGFVGYQRRLFDRVQWRIQLNVRNLFDHDDIIEQRAASTGMITNFTIPTPRTYIISSSFTF
jgi:iron complex outermembrane recepter protein